MIEFTDVERPEAVLKVFGVGGGGGNALMTMMDASLHGVDFVVANTDLQALRANPAAIKVQLGNTLTKGLGAGANPEVGRSAALEDRERLAEVINGADMVFITCGMGGGTGTGAAPVIAEVAKAAGALTVGVVTKPFSFEGRRRARQAEEGVNELREVVDTLITIPNNRLLEVAGEHTAMKDAFKLADDVLMNAVKGISDVINVHGFINVDFADVQTIMSNQGMALMGTGRGSGETRAIQAAESAIHSPLLDNMDIAGAMGILINITGGSNLTLHEVNAASTAIAEAAHEDANIIFGSVIDESFTDEMKVTVIATGFEQERPQRRATVPTFSAPAEDLSTPPLRTQDRDIPTHIRNRWQEQGSEGPKPHVSEPPSSSDFGGDNQLLDIPTFLRRQAD